MIREVLSLYSATYPKVLVYMLQASEYQAGAYLRWFWRVRNFHEVMYRRGLELTRPAKLLLVTLDLGMLAAIAGSLITVGFGLIDSSVMLLSLGLVILLAYPFLLAILVIVPLWLGDKLIISFKRRKVIKKAERIFGKHPGVKIAVAGSYGKTSMKELLATVLGHGFDVAATPGNKNVLVSHAYFARRLTGHEDVVIIEYGEGEPGDIGRFARLSHPNHGVITGLAPAHLDRYKTLQAAGTDIFSLAGFVGPDMLYVNRESEAVKPFLEPQFKLYDASGALGWKTEKIKVEVTGTSFVMKHGSKELKMSSQLIGRHQVGPLAFVAAFAQELGMSKDKIEQAVKLTKPHEHRMQPYQLAGAWVIDDTYNGNIEGIRAGTGLLKELSAKRKIYVTPGLVDQGEEKQAVHEQMGEYIAEAQPDVVVLMRNSVTEYIQDGLIKGGYTGQLRIETDSLHFYTNLNQFVAAGDVMMLQNDWPDNYA